MLEDIKYFKGQFYTITNRGVWVIDNHDPPRLLLKKNYDCSYFTRYYLVEVSGALWIVKQFCDCVVLFERKSGDFEFQVWQLDLIEGEAKEIKILGDNALFLGRTASTSTEPSIGVKPNHIYFTGKRGGNYYIRAYNLEDGKTTCFNPDIHVSPKYPSTWVMPSI